MSGKKITSLDKEITLTYDEVKNVCICVVLYPLLQYMLIEDLDAIRNHTLYILDETIPDEIQSRLPTYTYHSSTTIPLKKLTRKFIRTFRALTRDLRHPYLKTATIYAQDHDLVSTLIGKHDYFLLSDGPDMLTRCCSEEGGNYQRYLQKANSFQGKIEELVYGTPFVHHYGNNKQCKRIYMTEENFAPIVQQKEVLVNSLQEMWSKASPEKRNFILHIFGVQKEDLNKLEDKPIIFFTQPLCDDQLLSRDEYLEMLVKIFNYYGHSQILIKTHPRDKFDYRKHFPDIALFDKPIIIQLLTLLNISFAKAVTLFSTAVLDLPENIQVDWLGTNGNSKLLTYIGKDITPHRCHRVTIP